MRMPILDGYQATRYIKSQPQGQHTCIIALTASAFEEDRSRVLAVGCDDFIRKPFQEADLFEKMAQHLGVAYTYAPEPALPPPPILLATAPSSRLPLIEALHVMPLAWLQDLQRAATRADGKQVTQLLQALPGHQATLQQALANLVHGFRFDVILELVKAAQAADTPTPDSGEKVSRP